MYRPTERPVQLWKPQWFGKYEVQTVNENLSLSIMKDMCTRIKMISEQVGSLLITFLRDKLLKHTQSVDPGRVFLGPGTAPNSTNHWYSLTKRDAKEIHSPSQNPSM